MKRYIAIFACLAAVFSAYPAQAKSIWNILFPYLAPPDKDPDNNMQAPFAEPPASAVPKNALTDLYEANRKSGALDQPHRQSAEIGSWLEHAISEIFSIDGTGYDAHLKHLRTGMDDNAMRGYETYVQQSNIIAILTSNNMKLTGFADDRPVLLNEGAVDGRYRWLFDVPVTLSYIPRDQKTYRGTVPQAHRATVTVQVGRVPRGQGSDELMIETFDLKGRAE